MAYTALAVISVVGNNQSAVVNALQRRNDIIQTLYGNRKSDTDLRIKMYVNERSAIDVYPTFVGTICKYTSGGAIGGGVIGAIAGLGNPIVVGAGAGAGAIMGFGYGCHVAYKEQQYVYKDWLVKATNKKINIEVLNIVRNIVKEKANNMDPNLADLMDPINDNFMQRPVIDPTNGMVFDFTQHDKWIAQNGRSYWTNRPLKVTDLKICYATCGRMSRLYTLVLREELNGAHLTPEQKKCITLLLTDLARDIRYYYNEARAYLDRLQQSGVIDPVTHGERLTIIARMLYPTDKNNDVIQRPLSSTVDNRQEDSQIAHLAIAVSTTAPTSSSPHISPTSSLIQMLRDSPPHSPKNNAEQPMASSIPSISLTGSLILVTPPITPKSK